MKRITAKEMSMIYAQRLEEKTQKRIREQEELKRFIRRVFVILLLSFVVLVLLMMTFTPSLVENTVTPVVQLLTEWFKTAKPVVSHVAGNAESLKPAAQGLFDAAKSLVSP